MALTDDTELIDESHGADSPMNDDILFLVVNFLYSKIYLMSMKYEDIHCIYMHTACHCIYMHTSCHCISPKSLINVCSSHLY